MLHDWTETSDHSMLDPRRRCGYAVGIGGKCKGNSDRASSAEALKLREVLRYLTTTSMLYGFMLYHIGLESQSCVGTMVDIYLSANKEQSVRLAYVHRCISGTSHPIHALMSIVLVMPYCHKLA